MISDGCAPLAAGKPSIQPSCPCHTFNVPRGLDMLLPLLEADAAQAQRFFARLRMVFYARAGLIGLPLPDMARKFVSTDGGVGSKQELRVRGVTVFPGYRDAPELSARTFDAGAGEVMRSGLVTGRAPRLACIHRPGLVEPAPAHPLSGYGLHTNARSHRPTHQE